MSAKSWKYVIMVVEGVETPILFPSNLNHDMVARGIDLAHREQCRKQGNAWTAATPVAAGFVDGLHIDGTYGKSMTLALGPLGDDAKTINELVTP